MSTEFRRIMLLRQALMPIQQTQDTEIDFVANVKIKELPDPDTRIHGIHYQRCGGGRRVLKKKIGG